MNNLKKLNMYSLKSYNETPFIGMRCNKLALFK